MAAYPTETTSTSSTPSSTRPKSFKYGRLCKTHPELDLKKVKILKALYKGGSHLLKNVDVMKEVFPKYAYESDAVYEERKKRAYYENMFALCINQISAGLAQDPIRFEPPKDPDESKMDLGSDPHPAVQPGLTPSPFAKKFPPAKPDDKKPDDDDEEDDKDKDAKDKKPPFPPKKDDKAAKPPAIHPVTGLPIPPPVIPKKMPEQPKLDQYWLDLMDNATALTDDGSGQKSFDQQMRDAAVEALVTGWGWIQCDLPKEADPDDPYAPKTLKEQEDSGGLRSYTCFWPTDQVVDWQEKAGKLLWVRTYECYQEALTPDADRDNITHCWTVWDAEGWSKYEFVQEMDPQTNVLKPMPGPQELIPQKEEGTHSFKRVPWNRLDVCHSDGTHLHIGDFIESLCRNYFNRQNGESFQWSQYFYQQLYEFLGPEVAGIDTVVSEAQQDPSRAQRRRAPGMVHVRGNEDRAEFVGPDMSGAEVGRNANQDSRDAILRVTAQMALAQDTSGAMLRRSADSKRQDSVAQEIVLGSVGKRIIVFGTSVAKTLQVGRGEDVEDVPEVKGYQHFNTTNSEDLVNQALNLETVKIPSARFQIEKAYQVATAFLGDNAGPEILQEIRQQLEKAITQDQVMSSFTQPPPPPLGAKLEQEEGKENGDEDKPDDEDEDKKSPFGKKPGGFPPKKPNPFAGGSPKSPFGGKT